MNNKIKISHPDLLKFATFYFNTSFFSFKDVVVISTQLKITPSRFQFFCNLCSKHNYLSLNQDKYETNLVLKNELKTFKIYFGSSFYVFYNQLIKINFDKYILLNTEPQIKISQINNSILLFYVILSVLSTDDFIVYQKKRTENNFIYHQIINYNPQLKNIVIAFERLK